MPHAGRLTLRCCALHVRCWRRARPPASSRAHVHILLHPTPWQITLFINDILDVSEGYGDDIKDAVTVVLVDYCPILYVPGAALKVKGAAFGSFMSC